MAPVTTTPPSERGPAPSRCVAVWCDQWPVVAAGVSADEAVAVVDRGRVAALTPAAAGRGVAVGQRIRDAQSRCPDITLRDIDARRGAAAFEPVLTAVETFSPRIEIGGPGDCVIASRGPARYFGGDGGEEALAHQVAAAVDDVLAAVGWPGWVRVAVADGAAGTRLVARHLADSGPGGVVVVPPGRLARALADLPVDVVCSTEVANGVDPGLSGLLHRLGLSTVGAFAALEPGDVLARFGTAATHAHALACGNGDRRALGEPPPPELVVGTVVDPPAERADAVAFAARPVAEEFHRRLTARGCTTAVVTIEFTTDHAETCERVWRHDGSVAGLVDRVRWQLDGWLSGPASNRPTAGVSHIRLLPGDVVAASGRQLGLWGEESAADQRARRAVARLDGLLGPGAVTVPLAVGGRGPGDRVVRVAAAMPPGEHAPVRVDAPWPGAVPPPEPAVVHRTPVAIEVVDATGDAVGVDGRHQLSAPPVWVGPPGRAFGNTAGEVRAWAGPWPTDERWWDPAAHRRRARMQLWCETGPPLLVVREGGQWWREATYD